MIDHILPRRLFRSATQANAAENLSALCFAHHGAKGRVENRLFQGDWYPLKRWMDALSLSGPVPTPEMVERALKRLRLLMEAND